VRAPSTTLGDALRVLGEGRIHQLYLVDPGGGAEPAGVITLGDLLARLVA
jgi:CBS domain-containing protein